MITLLERNLFGKWEPVPKKTFDTLEAARAWCINMSDTTGIAYLVLQNGELVDGVDMQAGFFALGSKPDAENSEGK